MTQPEAKGNLVTVELDDAPKELQKKAYTVKELRKDLGVADECSRLATPRRRVQVGCGPHQG